MKSSILRKVAIIILAVSLLGSTLTGCKNKDAKDTTDNKPMQEVKIKVTSGMFKYEPKPDVVVQKEWIARMEKHLGKKLNVEWQWIPWGDLGEKVKIQLASNDLSDITLVNDGSLIQQYGKQGTLVDLSTHMDKLPNYKKWIEEAKNGKASVYTKENKLFAFHEAGVDPLITTQAFFQYRYDIFEKNNIKIPGTFDELYDAAKKLKELYPNSYPLGNEKGLIGWYGLAKPFMLANHTSDDVTWDGSKFIFGPTTDNMKDTITYLSKLYKEKLIDPGILVDTKDQFRKKLFNDKVFIVPNGWGNGINELNTNPDVKIKMVGAMTPKNDKYGTPWQFLMGSKGKYLANWAGLVVSPKTKALDDILKMLDYQYSDDIVQLVNWGIEGTTYKKDDKGKKVFLPEIMAKADPMDELAKLGVSSTMACRTGIPFTPQDKEAQYNLTSPSAMYLNGKLSEAKNFWFASADVLKEDNYPSDNFRPITNFSTDDNDVIANNMKPIRTYVEQSLTKFIMGETSMDKWNEYVTQVKKLGDLDKVLQLHNDAAKASK